MFSDKTRAVSRQNNPCLIHLLRRNTSTRTVRVPVLQIVQLVYLRSCSTTSKTNLWQRERFRLSFLVHRVSRVSLSNPSGGPASSRPLIARDYLSPGFSLAEFPSSQASPPPSFPLAEFPPRRVAMGNPVP